MYINPIYRDPFKVIPHICIAHPYCAQFMASLARARAHAH